MKNDLYFPHELSKRSDARIMELIAVEGCCGYGFYWAILEYLRAQDQYQYVGKTSAIKNIARHMRVRNDKAQRVLNNFELFIVEGDSFYSPEFIELMQPLERKRAQKAKLQSRQKEYTPEQAEISSANDQSLSDFAQTVSQPSYNSLKTNKGVKINKKNKKKDNDDKSSLSEKNRSHGDDDDAEAENIYPDKPSWEKHVDDAGKDQKWLEALGGQCQLSPDLISKFPKVIELFKRHVVSLGKEDQIESTFGAKRYLNFFLKPGSRTREWIAEQFRLEAAQDPYRFEHRDPKTGERSYCGVPIPPDAPPRPNDQAVWNPLYEKWRY